VSDKSYSSKLTRPSPLFIGIDLGTSGCRAIAIDTSGEIKAESEHHYSNQKGHHQQTPQDWWQATQTVLRDITSKVNHQHIHSIAVDGTSSTVLLCNDAGQPLTPALMYNDQHAKEQAVFLQQYANKNSVVVNPTSGLAKVLWLNEHHTPNESFHIVHQADWIAGQLCRRFDFSDVNNALKTGFDSINNLWPLWLLDLFTELKINPASLPKVFSPGSFVSNINLHVARDLGLPIDVEIIAGTTDSTAAFIACSKNSIDNLTTGDAVTSLGTTLVLKVVSDHPINDPAHGVYSQPYGERWLVGGASNSGGAVLRYYFSDEQMLSLSKQLKPDIVTNLNYYPLLKAGERFPINNPDLAPRISPKVESDAIFFQGLLEGIAEIEHAGYKLLKQLGAPYPTSVLTAGGGAINTVWQQIREQKLGVPVVAAEHTAAAYGAAKLAANNYIKSHLN
jgi:sugar (pentulose or hexulose) kinase